MLGLLFAELKRFLETKGAGDVWRESVVAAGLETPAFAASHRNDSEAFHALVEAAAVRMRTSPVALLGDLGERLGENLVLAYRDAIDPAWSTIDLLERSQPAIRTVAAHGGGDAEPPQFATHLDDGDTIVFDWYAPKKLCPLAKGAVRGIAEMMGDRIETVESFCMERGDDHCEMTFRALETHATVV